MELGTSPGSPLSHPLTNIPHPPFIPENSRSFVFRQRNFDRGTRQPIKAVQAKPAVVADVETVEKRVAGLAERIIAEDAVKRMEELVSVLSQTSRVLLLFVLSRFRCELLLLIL